LIKATVDERSVNYQLMLETCSQNVKNESEIDYFNSGASEAPAAYAKGVIDDFEQVDQWFNEHLLNALVDISDKL
jgi:hypothetical protein